MKKIYFLLFIVTMIACKDDDKPSASVSAILTSKANGWVISSLVVGSTDAFQGYDDCEKDDATVFLSAGTYQVNSTVKCDSGETNPIDTGTWSLSSDQKTLTVSGGDFPFTATILEADETHLKATITVDFGTGPISATLTLVPK
jgi:hypothetical protein